jgi:hypothetical protein
MKGKVQFHQKQTRYFQKEKKYPKLFFWWKAIF